MTLHSDIIATEGSYYQMMNRDNRGTGLVRALLKLMARTLHGIMEYDEVQMKVLRTQEAKQFPLIRIKKDGDVGYDLPAILPYKEEYASIDDRLRYLAAYPGMDRDEIDSKIFRQSIIIAPRKRGVIPTGIRLEIPRGYWASIEARSSTSKSMLMCPKGVIDEGYRGELFAVLLNVGDTPVTIYHGDRYVQLIPHKRQSGNIRVVEVDNISESERGDSGFGSTGQSAINK